MARVEVLTPLSEILLPEDAPPNLIAAADLLQLDTILVGARSTAHTPFGAQWIGEIAFEQEAVFAVPGLPLAIALGPPAAASPVTARLLLADDWVLEIDGLSVALRFDPLILRPVDRGEAFAEIRATTGLRVTPRSIELVGPSVALSLPLSEIPGTGIAIALNGLRVDLDPEQSPDEIVALGYDETFKGVYAESALVRLLPGLVFGGSRGIQVTATDVAVSVTGITCSIEQDFVLARTGTVIDPASEAVGALLSAAWPFALTRIQAELFDSVPLFFQAEGVLRVPLLERLFAIRFDMHERSDGGGYDVGLAVQSLEPATAQTPYGSIGIDSIAIEGELRDDAIELRGMAGGVTVDLAPLHLAAASVAVSILHEARSDEVRLFLTEVPLGPLGTLDSLELVYREAQADDGSVAREVVAEASLSWDDLRARIDVPDFFPLPTAGEQAQVRLSWREDPAGGPTTLEMSIAVELRDVGALFAFLPPAIRPVVEQASLRIDVEYADEADFASAADDSNLSGSVAIDVRMRLPPFPPFLSRDLIQVTTGDASGVIGARIALTADSAGTTALRLSVTDLVTLGIQVPGMPAPTAPLQIALTAAEMALSTGATSDAPVSEGAIELRGTFAFDAVAPPPDLPIAAHLARLLEPLHVSPLTGSVTGALRFRDGAALLDLACDFEEARIEADVFDLVANLARGVATPANVLTPRNAVDLDLEVGFGLRRVEFAVGSLDGPSQVSFEIAMEAHVGPASAEGFLRISDTEVVIGVSELDVPLRTPRFPLSAVGLDALRVVPGDPASLWDRGAVADQLAVWEERIADLNDAADAGDAAARRERGDLASKTFLLSNLDGIDASMPAAENRRTFESGVDLIVGILDTATGVFHVESDLVLRIERCVFRIPFQDPRGIAVEGGARIVGFAPDDPFKALGDITMVLGLSADQIYFSMEGSGEPIPIPEIGRYDNGYVSFSRLTIGYGFTRNSLAMAFAGALKFPDGLVEDADLSSGIGFGIRLPQFNALAFRLDLIPVPGPIPVVPLLEFNVDLRTPGLPGIAATQVCTPQWDGLQLHVPGVIRADFKAAAFSPFFSIFPIPNLRLDGDIQIGDDATGVTLVLNDALFLAGITAPPVFLPIPLLAEPMAPYVENLCVHVAIAGFQLNFDLQRPFPTFDPMLLFDVLALIADPMRPVDPGGPLARSVRVTLQDAYVAIPEVVQRLFPGAGDLRRKELNVEVNLGTVITVAQFVARTIGEAMAVVHEAGEDVRRGLEELASHPPELAVGTLLAALPPEMRKVRMGGSFAGFDAAAMVLLISPDDARAEFARRDSPVPPAPPFRPAVGTPTDAGAAARYQPDVGDRDGGRAFDPDDPSANLFRGIELRDFTATDVDAIPAARRPMAGVMLGARVRVFRDQRVRFLGALFEDGSFALISALDIRPLQLRIAGIAVSLPLRLSGRLVLTGRAKRDGYQGSIDARGYCSWNVVPGVLQLNIASSSKPALFRLRGDGTFTLSGDLRMVLFGAVTVDGTVEVDETHCFVSGSLTYRSGKTPGRPGTPVIDLAVSTVGRVGPGPTFEIAGDGELSVFGHPLTKVSAVVNETGAAVAAELHTRRWNAGGGPVDCQLDLELRGRIDLRKDAKTSFALEGAGSLEIFGARVVGRAALTATRGNVATEVAGRLVWQRREWLGGRVRVDTKGALVEGSTSFALDLTPSALGPGMKLATLFFRINLNGRFTLDKQAGLAAFSITGDALLGARLAKGNANNREQIFPLAMQSFAQDGEANLDLPLMHVDGFHLVPAFDLGDLDIPVPVLVPKDDALLRLKTRRVDDDHPDGKHRVRLRWDDRNILPFQIPLTDFVVPEFRVGQRLDLPLEWDVGMVNVTLPLSTRFDLALVWYQGGLAVRIIRKLPNGSLRTQHWKLRS